jgi:polysaccharide export outer membrane protein
MVPVIYRIDLKNPNSFFVMQSFGMANKDILYVSNAPAAELQKFLNLIVSVAYPVLTLIQVTK